MRSPPGVQAVVAKPIAGRNRASANTCGSASPGDHVATRKSRRRILNRQRKLRPRRRPHRRETPRERLERPRHVARRPLYDPDFRPGQILRRGFENRSFLRACGAAEPSVTTPVIITASHLPSPDTVIGAMYAGSFLSSHASMSNGTASAAGLVVGWAAIDRDAIANTDIIANWPVSLCLLGRHVLGGADDPSGHGQAVAGENLGDAEIGQLDEPLGGDQQVGGLQIAMNDAGVVRRLERLADLDGDFDRLLPGNSLFAAHQRHQRFTGDVFHRVVVVFARRRRSRTTRRCADS